MRRMLGAMKSALAVLAITVGFAPAAAQAAPAHHHKHHTVKAHAASTRCAYAGRC